MTDESSTTVTTTTLWKYRSSKNPKSDKLNVERLKSTVRLWVPMGGYYTLGGPADSDGLKTSGSR